MHARASALAVSALLVAVPCGGQVLPALAWEPNEVEQADAFYFAGRPREAFDLLREHLSEAPDDYEALWRVARSTVVLGVAEDEVRMQNSYFDTGMEFANRAVALRPDGIEGRYWHGAVTGRRALNAAPEYGAELAQRAYEDAHAILALDPEHGGAHNILGKIFFEVMSMSRIERFIGRTFVRTPALKESSWEAAEDQLQTAAAEWPDWVLFQYDLAELYRKRGRDDEARAIYQHVTHMPAVHPSDSALQHDAERVLEELGS